MSFREFGRPVKFYWREHEVHEQGDDAHIGIGHQDTDLPCYHTSLRQIKEFVKYIEKEQAEKEAKKK